MGDTRRLSRIDEQLQQVRMAFIPSENLRRTMLDLNEKNLNVARHVFGVRVIVASQSSSSSFGVLFFKQCDEGAYHNEFCFIVQHRGNHPQDTFSATSLHDDHDVASFG